jgi:hypothetical protein
MTDLNRFPTMTDQEVVDLVCELRASAPPDSLWANPEMTPALHSRITTAEQELVDRGYTESRPGYWNYEGAPDQQLTCT